MKNRMDTRLKHSEAGIDYDGVVRLLIQNAKNMLALECLYRGSFPNDFIGNPCYDALVKNKSYFDKANMDSRLQHAGMTLMLSVCLFLPIYRDIGNPHMTKS
jgi:hypothetical protein